MHEKPLFRRAWKLEGAEESIKVTGLDTLSANKSRAFYNKNADRHIWKEPAQQYDPAGLTDAGPMLCTI